MEIGVDCYAGYRGEETPRRLNMGTRQIAVFAVEDRWLAPDHRYFKLIGEDGHRYIVRHDPQREVWQLIYFTTDAARHARPTAGASPAPPPQH